MTTDDEELDDWEDYHDPSDDDFGEFEDEQASLRGTSQCDGLCDPQCDWCLVAHHCPDECTGGTCPYAELAALLHTEFDALDGRAVVLPNGVRIEVIECNGDAFNVFRQAQDDAELAMWQSVVGIIDDWRTK